MAMTLQSQTTHAIQLAIAPAFVLAAIGTTLTVLTNRLARIDDHAERSRASMKGGAEVLNGAAARELAMLDRRGRLIHLSISSAVACGLFVCAMVITIFIGDELSLAVDQLIALLFVSSMLSLSVTYAIFLVEIYLGAKMLKPDRPLAQR